MLQPVAKETSHEQIAVEQWIQSNQQKMKANVTPSVTKKENPMFT